MLVAIEPSDCLAERITLFIGRRSVAAGIIANVVHEAQHYPNEPADRCWRRSMLRRCYRRKMAEDGPLKRRGPAKWPSAHASANAPWRASFLPNARLQLCRLQNANAECGRDVKAMPAEWGEGGDHNCALRADSRLQMQTAGESRAQRCKDGNILTEAVTDRCRARGPCWYLQSHICRFTPLSLESNDSYSAECRFFFL